MKTLLRICPPTPIALVAAAAFLAGCDAGSQTVAIADVTRPQTMLVAKRPGQGYVHALRIEVSGEIEGEAGISLITDGKPYRTETLSGSVRFSWSNDWYSDVAEIRYDPGTSIGGNLRLRYRFAD